MLCTLLIPVSAGEVDSRVVRLAVEERQDAVVLVTATVKQAAGTAQGGQDARTEAIGTVISPSGLTVVSYSGLDPLGLVSEMMRKFRGSGHTASNEASIVTDAKIVLADGLEIPARLLLRESDLDIAFFAPEEAVSGTAPNAASRKFAYLDPRISALPLVLDDIVCVYRMGPSLGRQIAMFIDRVSAVVTKPRKFVVASERLKLGAPVLAASDGIPIGITTMRKPEPHEGGTGYMSHGMVPTPVIIPFADILNAAKQLTGILEGLPPLETFARQYMPAEEALDEPAAEAVEQVVAPVQPSAQTTPETPAGAESKPAVEEQEPVPSSSGDLKEQKTEAAQEGSAADAVAPENESKKDETREESKANAE